MDGEVEREANQLERTPPWKRIRLFVIIPAVLTFLVGPALFYWIGPVWTYAAETDLAPFLSKTVVVGLFAIALLIWIPVELHFFSGRGILQVLIPLIGGIVIGLTGSALVVWTL